MKTSIMLMFCYLTLTLACDAAATVPPESPWDKTHGNVRVVLMSISQTKYFPIDSDEAITPPAGDPRRGDIRTGVPCVVVTYLAESLGDLPKGAFSPRGLTLSPGGKRSKAAKQLRGAYRQIMSYEFFQGVQVFSKPKVSNPDRATIVRQIIWGPTPFQQSINLVIETGYGEDIHNFSFDSIRL